MKKYNLSSIMKKAWEIKHQDSRYIFSLCLKMAWAEAKAPKEYKNVVIEQYSSFNARRYSNPWVCLVDATGRLDFSRKIGAYTGAWGAGEEGDLYVFAPVEGQVYAYGQKDNRGNNGGYRYTQFLSGSFVFVSKSDLLKAIA